MKSLYRKLTFASLSKTNGKLFCILYNVMMLLNSGQNRCKFVDENYLISSGDTKLYFTRSARYRYYSEGIEHRLKSLFSQYVGTDFKIEPGDVIIDCGANIGEFSRYCQSRGALVYAFEPDPTEFKALKRNVGEAGNALPLALWFEDANLEILLQNETGDTSVAIDGGSGSRVFVEGKRLDSIRDFESISKIRLFKLEAEGFEPEVLQGTTGILHKIEYIAADLGPERGENNESTLPQVINFLHGYGFNVEYFFPGRCIVLFRNSSL